MFRRQKLRCYRFLTRSRQQPYWLKLYFGPFVRYKINLYSRKTRAKKLHWEKCCSMGPNPIVLLAARRDHLTLCNATFDQETTMLLHRLISVAHLTYPLKGFVHPESTMMRWGCGLERAFALLWASFLARKFATWCLYTRLKLFHQKV